MKKQTFWAVRHPGGLVDIFRGRKPKRVAVAFVGHVWEGTYATSVCHKLARLFFQHDFPTNKVVQIAGKVYRTVKGGK